MRHLLLVTFCVLSYALHAQTGVPMSHPFNERYYFIDSDKYLLKHRYAEIADTLRQMERTAEAAGNYEFSGQLKLYGYSKLYREGATNVDTLEKYLLLLAADASSNKLVHLEANVLQLLGDFYFETRQQQSEGIEYYIASYDVYRNFSAEEFPPKQTYLYQLGGAFYRYEDYESAITYMQQALKTKKSTQNNIYCSIFNTIGMAYRQMGIYDSAILYYRKSYDAAVLLNNEAWKAIAEGNIGITYFYQGKYTEAIPLLENDIKTSIATVNVKNAVSSMGILATIYNNRKEYDRAEKTLKEALGFAQARHFWSSYSMAEVLYTQLYKAYAGKGNFRLAYLYADSALVAKDSASKQNNALTLAKAREKKSFLEHKLEAEKLQNEIRMGQVENRKTKIEITFTVIGIVVLLGVVIFIGRERKRSENLLLNILPEKIAERLKKKEHPIADYFDNASIIFIDMAGFTRFSDRRDPKEVVNILNHVFTTFDAIAERHGLEKIKTIGDCYMAVSGLPEPNPDHAEAATQMALGVREEMKDYKAADGTPIEFRIGLDCGPVVAGVIGRRKFIYDLWGDTVNTASRMESTGLAGEIQCSDRFKKKIEHKHKFVSRGETDVKGKGIMETWLIVE